MDKSDTLTDKIQFMKRNKINLKDFSWKKYLFETLSIFIAVISAFTLNNWNLNRRDANAEKQILKELKLAIKNDLRLIRHNTKGNTKAKQACDEFRKLIDNQPYEKDSIVDYFNEMFSDFPFTPNTTGYKGLESKGFDIIKDEFLRSEITYYYNYYFYVLEKAEIYEQQYQIFDNYFLRFTDIVSANLKFNQKNELISINQPVSMTNSQRQELYSYLWQMKKVRKEKLRVYNLLKSQLKDVQKYLDSITKH